MPKDGQVIEALERSGFLFEQEVATAIEESGFHVETCWPYLDPDSGKSREMDLRAVKCCFTSKEHNLSVWIELLIECKDSNAPLVFLERPKNKRELESPNPSQYLFPRKAYTEPAGNNSVYLIPAFKKLGLSSSHYYFGDSTKATQFSKIVRKGSEWVANHEGIYDSLFLPMAKALEARINAVPGPSQTGSSKMVWLFFPVVVLRDNLMSLSVKGTERELKRKGRVTFVRGLDSQVLKGDYLIDFVTFDYLKEYLERDVGGFASSVAEMCRSSPLLLRGEAT